MNNYCPFEILDNEIQDDSSRFHYTFYGNDDEYVRHEGYRPENVLEFADAIESLHDCNKCESCEYETSDWHFDEDGLYDAMQIIQAEELGDEPPLVSLQNIDKILDFSEIGIG